MNNLSIIYTTIGSEEDAKNFGRILIENKMAVCCNIIKNVYSIYEWKNEIHENDEFVMIIKTIDTINTYDFIKNIIHMKIQ